MTGKKKMRGSELQPQFPALREFFSGYLHQDFRHEYGSATGAAGAFRKDANAAEIQAVQNEWKIWRSTFKKSSLDEIAMALRQLGAAWQPRNERELDEVAKVLAQS